MLFLKTWSWLVCSTSQQDCGALLVALSTDLFKWSVLWQALIASQRIACALCPISKTLSIHSAMDAFAQTLMKDAVNCDKHSDLQNSVNQLDFEYGLCCRGCLCKHTFSIYSLLCTVCLCVWLVLTVLSVLNKAEQHRLLGLVLSGFLWLCWVYIKDMFPWCSLQGPAQKVSVLPVAFCAGWVGLMVLSHSNYDVDERTHWI